MNAISDAFKEIDPDRTGYVTAPEMDDLFRYLFPEEFRDKQMFEIVKPFEIQSNRILIEYNKFRQWLMRELGIIKRQFDSIPMEGRERLKFKSRQAARDYNSSVHNGNEDTVSKKSFVTINTIASTKSGKPKTPPKTHLRTEVDEDLGQPYGASQTAEQGRRLQRAATHTDGSAERLTEAP